MQLGDTIVALSSGAPPSGVAVIRLSGALVTEIITTLAGGTLPEPRKLVLCPIGCASLLDRGFVAYFPAPHSFTGEDCAELQVHGSPAGIRAILKLVTSLGARLAQAGEFTRRAFENGKLNLIEIEGLGDLLEAETENQRRQALARLEGGLSQQIESWHDQLLNLRAEIEARLDFFDEGDVGDLPESFGINIAVLATEIRIARDSANHGRIIREGIRVALAGAPNVGKSSLLNALVKTDIAIVTNEAGTTRDIREVPLDIDGQLYILLDLAGLRDTESIAEAEGIRRARQAIEQADIVLWLTAPDVVTDEIYYPTDHSILVGTKADLGQIVNVDVIVSAQTGQGLPELFACIKSLGDRMIFGEPPLLSRERDRIALQEALLALQRAEERLKSPELAAEDLRIASQALERLVGRLDAERVLDRLFASFCIGK